MPQMSRMWPIASLMALASLPVASASVPALAQSIEALEQIARSGDVPEEGLALARSQVEAGALLEALATLDRTLAVKPKNKQARLLHARIMCMIDDRTGAAVEFARLKAKDYPKAQWAEAQARCNQPASKQSEGAVP